MRKNKNFIKIGLKSDKKLKKSFYNFLYDKHFDWAIILAAFFSPLPYISSKNNWFLITKTFIFLLIVFFCFRYILNWRRLQAYYKVYEQANQQSKSLIDKNILNESKINKYGKFNRKFISKLENLGKSYKENKNGSTFQEFLKKNPEKGKPLQNLFSQDTKLTKTFFGGIMHVITSILHLRKIPRSELYNYRILLFIVFSTLLFFFVYALEINLL